MIEKEYIEGAIYGALVGDYLGYRRQTGEVQKGIFTDQGSTLLCTIASINEMGNVNKEDILDKIYDFYVGGYMRPMSECIECSPTLSEIVKKYNMGIPADRCGITGSEGLENSSLCRTIPVALFSSSQTLKKFIENIDECTVLTHNKETTKLCAQIYSLIYKIILNNEQYKSFATIKKFHKQNNPKMLDVLESLETWKEENTLEGSSFVVDTFWTTCNIFSKAGTDYEKCMELSAKAEDAKTVGCLVGGLSGSIIGINNIPDNYISDLQIDDMMRTEINRFVKKCVKLYSR